MAVSGSRHLFYLFLFFFQCHVGSWSAGPEGGQPGHHGAALHQDESVARLRRGDLLPPGVRGDPQPGGAGLRNRRLRLHDLHRQLREAQKGNKVG